MPERRRVLIADDQRPTRKGLKALLDLAPDVAWVREAANGQEAINMVEAWRPDVVLMDARMPVLDGIAATQRIKSLWPRVKVIVLTLYAEYQAQALAAGADVFLVKGGPSESLLSAICKA
jgi:DNA-binding NarL/FixJ family response regulator